MYVFTRLVKNCTFPGSRNSLELSRRLKIHNVSDNISTPPHRSNPNAYFYSKAISTIDIPKAPCTIILSLPFCYRFPDTPRRHFTRCLKALCEQLCRKKTTQKTSLIYVQSYFDRPERNQKWSLFVGAALELRSGGSPAVDASVNCLGDLHRHYSVPLVTAPHGVARVQVAADLLPSK